MKKINAEELKNLLDDKVLSEDELEKVSGGYDCWAMYDEMKAQGNPKAGEALVKCLG